MTTLLILFVFVLGFIFGYILAPKKKSSNFWDEEQEPVFVRPKIVFHGGCLGCSMQTQHGIEFCTGCKYFECDWSLPDLNDEHARQDLEKEMIREQVKIQALLKRN